MASKYFNQVSQQVPAETKIFISKTLDIVEQVYLILDKSNISQKELAKMLGKSESEVSKWLSGLHNLTIKSIAKLESILKADIITTPSKSSATSIQIGVSSVNAIRNVRTPVLKRTFGTKMNEEHTPQIITAA